MKKEWPVVSRSLFISYLGVVGLITVSPGPDTALVVRNAVRFGTSNGLRTAAGSEACLTLPRRSCWE